METQVLFRRMHTKDIEDILVVEKACFRSGWTPQAFYNELKNNQFACYILIEYEEQVVGYGGMWIIINEAHITNIAVHPAYQRKGLGLRLMGEMMNSARTMGADKMTLEVRESNNVAKHLYAKLGFEVTGVRPGYYSDNLEDALIMWVNLYD